MHTVTEAATDIHMKVREGRGGGCEHIKKTTEIKSQLPSSFVILSPDHESQNSEFKQDDEKLEHFVAEYIPSHSSQDTTTSIQERISLVDCIFLQDEMRWGDWKTCDPPSATAAHDSQQDERRYWFQLHGPQRSLREFDPVNHRSV